MPTTEGSIVHIDEITRALLPFCDKATLAVLARTSSVFTECALDLLWYELESFWHLLRLFPENVLSWSASKPIVTRLIIPRDWARFKYYAQRVRQWGNEDLSYVEELLVDHLSFGRQTSHIIPRLLHMHVRASNVSSIHLQTLILSPSIESINIWNEDPDMRTTSSLSTFWLVLADTASNLKSLEMKWGDGVIMHDQFLDGLTDLFEHRFESLSVVKIHSPGCIGAKGFKALALLPALSNLHINLRQIHDIYNFTSELRGRIDVFPALKNLYLSGEPGTFHKVISTCFAHSPHMVSLGFGVEHYPQSRDLQQLFEVVVSKFPSLCTIQFNVVLRDDGGRGSGADIEAANRMFRDSTELYHHDLSTLSSLLQLRHLIAVHLEFGVPLHLTNADLEVIATSWPHIKMLNLCSNPLSGAGGSSIGGLGLNGRWRNYTYHHPSPAPTLAGLFTLTRCCSSLEHVGLGLDVIADADSQTSFSQITSLPIISSSLKMLNVGWSRCARPERLAALLSGAFPNLARIECATYKSPTPSGPGARFVREEPEEELRNSSEVGWRFVAEVCDVMRAVRANERTRLTAKNQADGFMMGTDSRMAID